MLWAGLEATQEGCLRPALTSQHPWPLSGGVPSSRASSRVAAGLHGSWLRGHKVGVIGLRAMP